MPYRFQPMGEADAHAIVGWRYEGPYSVYNSGPKDMHRLLDPKNSYYSVADEHGELIGFCCFGPDARVPGGDYNGTESGTLDVGLGLRPDLTGRGMGLDFVSAVLEFANKRFSPSAFRLTVATFNERAQRVYARAGFQQASRFRGGQDGQQFPQMTRMA